LSRGAKVGFLEIGRVKTILLADYVQKNKNIYLILSLLYKMKVNCNCLVTAALLGSSVVTGLLVNYTHFTNFEKSLTIEQMEKYKMIKRERMIIYSVATIIGLIAGFMNHKNTCIAVSSALFLQVFIYKLWPKSDYMLNHVETPDQSKLWMKKYTHMTFLSNVGMLVGLIAYFVLLQKYK
jgi:hypothetical protein